MKGKVIVLALALAALLMAAGALYSRLGEHYAPEQLSANTQPAAPTAPAVLPTETTEAPLPMAPDFTVYDLDGSAVKLSDFFGKPVVLNFWASWCGPCKMEMPDFNETCQALGDEIAFLMVNMTDGSRETVDTASAFIQEQGYVFPVFYDTDGDAAGTYGVYSLPTTYFIDAQGHAIAQATGAISGDTLQRGIDMITNS